MSEKSEGLESFVAIVEQGSIAAAARHLGVPRETLSRRLSRLEERVSARLLLRSPRGLSTTTEGRALYPHARRMVDATEEALRAVHRVDDVPRGVLRVSIPPGGAESLVAPMFQAFVEAAPEVKLTVLCTDRYVDLRTEGIDVALRGGDPQHDSLVARKLWRSDVVAVAAAAYVERRGLPSSLDELARYTCILSTVGGQPSSRWPTLQNDTATVEGPLATNDLALRMALVRRGIGIGLTLRPLVAQDLASGALIQVLPGVLGSTARMNVVFAERDLMQPRVRAFIDHVVCWFVSRDLDT